MAVAVVVQTKVKIGFLMKGHTHEDVDQLFSRISLHTSKRNIPTLSSLMNCIPQAYNKPNTTAERVHSIFNIRDWLHPHLHKLSHHSHPHQFRLTCNQDGKAVLHTKKWSSDREWQATTGEEFLITNHPNTIPGLVTPSTAELGLGNLRRDMPKYRPYFTQNDVVEWEDLISSLETCDDDNQNATWVMTDLIMGKDHSAPSQQPEPQSTPCFINDEQSPIQPVNLGPKRRQERAPPPLKIGSMIGVYLEEFRHEWPQVGQVQAMKGEEIQIHWYSGTATSSWTPLYMGEGQEPFTHTVQNSTVITSPFNLTGTAKLPQEIQRQLKEKEEEFYLQ